MCKTTSLCSTIWNPADKSLVIGQVRNALVLHLGRRFTEAAETYQQSLTAVPGLSGCLHEWVADRRKAALARRPLRQDCVEAHFNEVRAASRLSPLSLSDELRAPYAPFVAPPPPYPLPELPEAVRELVASGR